MANEGKIEFSGLWNILEKKGLNKQWLRNHGIYPNTVAKLTQNGNVTCDVICKLCNLLDCQPGDLMEYKKEDENDNV